MFTEIFIVLYFKLCTKFRFRRNNNLPGYLSYLFNNYKIRNLRWIFIFLLVLVLTFIVRNISKRIVRRILLQNLLKEYFSTNYSKNTSQWIIQRIFPKNLLKEYFPKNYSNNIWKTNIPPVIIKLFKNAFCILLPRISFIPSDLFIPGLRIKRRDVGEERKSLVRQPQWILSSHLPLFPPFRG